MARSRAYGSDSTVLLSFEETYGTFPEAGWRKIPIQRGDPGRDVPLIDEPMAGEGPEAQDPDYDPETVTPSFTVPIDVRNIGLWLKLLFNTPVTKPDGKGKHVHVFTSGKDLLSASIELGHASIAKPTYFMVTGFKAGSISFDMSRRGRAMATISGIAQAAGKSTRTAAARPEKLAGGHFLNKRGTLRVNGVRDRTVTGGSFEFNHNLEAVETLRGDGLIEDVDYTRQTARGNVAVRYTGDAVLTTAMDAETPAGLGYTFAMDGKEDFSLGFAAPRVFLPKRTPPIDGPGGVAQTYDWQASGADPDKALLEVTLINDVEAY